jgi:hypothetical protein
MAVDQAAEILKITFAKHTADSPARSPQPRSDFAVVAKMGRAASTSTRLACASPACASTPTCVSIRRTHGEPHRARSLGGRLTGRADFPKLERFIVDGAIENIPIQRGLQTVVPSLPRSRQPPEGLAPGRFTEESCVARSLQTRKRTRPPPAAGGVPAKARWT